MKKKIRGLFLVVLMTQLLVSCCRTKTYEVTITGLETRAFISEGTNVVEFDTQNSIDKEDLVIEIFFIEMEEIVTNDVEKKFRKDKSVVEAAVVPCEDQIVNFVNSVESITIEVIDVDNNNETTNISNQVVIYGTQSTLAEFLTENSSGLGNILVEFSDTNSIPNRIEYTIEATLDDGTTINTRGGIINFN